MYGGVFLATILTAYSRSENLGKNHAVTENAPYTPPYLLIGYNKAVI